MKPQHINVSPMHQRLVDLEALLATMDSAYPIAPEKAIKAVHAAIAEINELRYRLGTVLAALQMIQTASVDAAARSAATSAIKAIEEQVQP